MNISNTRRTFCVSQEAFSLKHPPSLSFYFANVILAVELTAQRVKGEKLCAWVIFFVTDIPAVIQQPFF